jgi:hypothetical protein
MNHTAWNNYQLNSSNLAAPFSLLFAITKHFPSQEIFPLEHNPKMCKHYMLNAKY